MEALPHSLQGFDCRYTWPCSSRLLYADNAGSLGPNPTRSRPGVHGSANQSARRTIDSILSVRWGSLLVITGKLECAGLELIHLDALNPFLTFGECMVPRMSVRPHPNSSYHPDSH